MPRGRLGQQALDRADLRVVRGNDQDVIPAEVSLSAMLVGPAATLDDREGERRHGLCLDRRLGIEPLARDGEEPRPDAIGRVVTDQALHDEV